MEIKKMVSLILMLVTLVSSIFIFGNSAKAATYIIDEVDLYSKGELVCLIYQKNIKVGVEFVVYKKNGVEYPAYCLNRNVPGVTSSQGYSVKAEKLVTDNKIWRAVTNGYPFKTAKQLGCNSDIEAFAATKMAVYDMMYNYDWNDFEGMNAQGDRVLSAAIKISKAARTSSTTKPISIVEIKTNDDRWKMDSINKEYASKTFYITTNVESTKYQVKLNNVKVKGVKITDERNEEKDEFKTGQKFKVLIPITELDTQGEFEIEVTADMKTKPILYGKSGSDNLQDYALAAGDYEYENAKMKVKYLENTTRIEIVKRDAETGELLKGAKFNVIDENKNIVYSDVTTNENGIATIENIMPGKYYIQEIKSPDGYTIYDEQIEIEVELNQKYVVNVNDYKKPENEEKEVEDGDKTITGQKEVNLPRTGF